MSESEEKNSRHTFGLSDFRTNQLFTKSLWDSHLRTFFRVISNFFKIFRFLSEKICSNQVLNIPPSWIPCLNWQQTTNGTIIINPPAHSLQKPGTMWQQQQQQQQLNIMQQHPPVLHPQGERRVFRQRRRRRVPGRENRCVCVWVRARRRVWVCVSACEKACVRVCASACACEESVAPRPCPLVVPAVWFFFALRENKPLLESCRNSWLVFKSICNFL